METGSQQGLSGFEETLFEQAEAKRQTKRAWKQRDRPATDHICSLCGRDCHSLIGLSSHTRIPCEQRPCSHGTQGTVREPPIRALHHSLSRLKDINTCTDVRCLKPFKPFLSLRASERIACEQALLFGRSERAWRERARQQQSCDGTPAFASPLACLLRVYFS